MGDPASIDSNYFPPFANYETGSTNINTGKHNPPPEQLLIYPFILMVELGSNTNEGALLYANLNAEVEYYQVSSDFASYINIYCANLLHRVGLKKLQVANKWLKSTITPYLPTARLSTLDIPSGIPGSVNDLSFVPIPQNAPTFGGYPPYNAQDPYLPPLDQDLNIPQEQMEYILTGQESQTR